jgi:hypothetical protein
VTVNGTGISRANCYTVQLAVLTDTIAYFRQGLQVIKQECNTYWFTHSHAKFNLQESFATLRWHVDENIVNSVSSKETIANMNVLQSFV